MHAPSGSRIRPPRHCGVKLVVSQAKNIVKVAKIRLES